MRLWGVFRQFLSAVLCAVFALPVFSTSEISTLSSPKQTHGSVSISAVPELTQRQHWSCAKYYGKNLIRSAVTYDYDAFGNLLHSTGSTFNEFLFAGEQFDSDLNLYYNRARYLNVSTGRFWTMDTFEGKDDNPASLHKYLYAGGDSVNKLDPSGRDFTLVGTLAAAIVLSILVAIPTARDSIGPGAPTYQITLEKITKDPNLGFYKQFRIMIHTQGDANQFLVVQWVRGSLTKDGHYGIVEAHQGKQNWPVNFTNWEIDSFSEAAEYPGDPSATSLTKKGALITFYDQPSIDPG